jgi:hypothetical protein
LVINVEGRAIAWPDPNRPFDRITHEIGPQRLNALYRRVLEAGTDRFSRPLLTHPKAIDALAEIRPDRVRVLPSETEIAGVGDASYFTIGLGGRVTDRDPAKDNDTSASVRRSLEIMRPVYDEVLKKGKPEKVDYVRHWHWESTGRGEIVQYIVVTDGYFAAWDWGWAGRPSCRKAIAADTQAHLLAELKRTGLFDLKPVRTAPPKTMYGSITIIEARIDGLEIRAIPTPALTGILTRFRRNLEAPSGN